MFHSAIFHLLILLLLLFILSFAFPTVYLSMLAVMVRAQETLQLKPVGRRDAGLYTCQAQNSVGSSEQLSVQLDIKCK